ncbi:conserved hypothetical protein [Burkholderiales bacterium 8X]|nr:conserved hypothetical protein [Burkholderiales bacterium 8X]
MSRFRLFYDEALTAPTAYDDSGEYFRKAKDRMDRSFDLIKRYAPNSRVVDVGASPFYLLYRAKQSGAADCHGIYFSHDSHPLRNTNQVFSDAGSINLSHADIEANNLPFADNSVDVLTACEILEHCEHFPQRFAREVRRVLRPNGILCITVPNVCSIANILKLIFQKNIYMKYRSDSTGRHKHEYTRSQLLSLAEYLGLDVLKIGFLPSPTSDKFYLRPMYKILATLPLLKIYSPVIYLVAQQRAAKSQNDLSTFPSALFDGSQSIES